MNNKEERLNELEQTVKQLVCISCINQSGEWRLFIYIHKNSELAVTNLISFKLLGNTSSKNVKNTKTTPNIKMIDYFKICKEVTWKWL